MFRKLVIFCVLLAGLSWAAVAGDNPATKNGVSVYFSPGGGCAAAIVGVLGAAKKDVFVAAYSFTSAPIAKALVEAAKRGVTVKVVLDKSQLTEKYSSADFMQHAGLAVAIDSEHAIAHNKYMIVDGGVVVTGSYNFTKSAEERNSENLLVLTSSDLASLYRKDWDTHWQHSAPYAGRPGKAE